MSKKPKRKHRVSMPPLRPAEPPAWRWWTTIASSEDPIRHIRSCFEAAESPEELWALHRASIPSIEGADTTAIRDEILYAFCMRTTRPSDLRDGYWRFYNDVRVLPVIARACALVEQREELVYMRSTIGQRISSRERCCPIINMIRSEACALLQTAALERAAEAA